MAAKKSSKMKRKSTSNTKMATSPKKLPTIKDPLSKSALIKTITDCTSLGKKDVVSVMDTFTKLIEKHVTGPGKFVLPGVLKITVVKKPARPARKGVNPFTGEEIMIKAKPAYKAIKIKALKKFKELVA